MYARNLTIFGSVLGLLAGAIALLWLLATPASMPDRRIPIAENAAESVAETVNIQGIFKQCNEKADIPTSSDWPQFRGPNRDNIATTSPRLAEKWGLDGPPVRWSVSLGEGYAGAAIWNGRVYVLDYDEARKSDTLRCFALDDGTELWQRSYKVKVVWNHGYSRTVPAIADGKVVTIGPKNQVLCVDALTGDYLWSLDMGSKYGAEVPLWYSAQCPYIADGKVFIAPSGTETLLVALDLSTGKILWQTYNPGGWKMSHSCIMPTEIGGVAQLLYFALGGAAGVEPTTGKVLWTTTAWAHNIVAPSPLDLGNGKILITSGHGVGSMLLEVQHTGDGTFHVLPPLKTWTKQELASEQHTPILHDGRLYIILPKDGGAMRLRLLCFDASDWRMLWSSDAGNRFGLGPYLVADGKIFVLEDNGMLTMVRASGEKYEELARVQMFAGKEAWAPMAFADGFLLLRDWKEMKCLDLR